MDVIVKGLLSSDKTVPIKRNVIQKIAKSASQPKQSSDIEKMFFLCYDTIVNTSDEFSYWACKYIYEEWVKYNSSTLASLFDRDRLLFFLNNDFRNNDGAIWIINESFKVLEKTSSVNYQVLCQTVESKAISYVREHPAFECITQFCKFLKNFVHCIPKGDMTATFCISIINAVSIFTVPAGEKSVHNFIKDVTINIGLFLKHIWTYADPDCMNKSLRALFSVISYVDDRSVDPCIALGGIVTHIPLELIDGVTKITVSDNSIKDASMKAALMRMIDWLNWPLAHHVEHWIVAFFKGLALVHKYTILIEVTEAKVTQVFERLNYPIVRERAFIVLSHMLCSFQHSPDAFHKIIQDVPSLVAKLKASKSQESVDFLCRFSELIHTLMYLHPGFPDLYDPVLIALQDLPRPSTEKMKVKLAQSKWTSEQKPGMSGLYRSTFGTKSETGKTGLINLGNTCFMNSIIQAIFMCDSFRQEVMKCIPSLPQQNLLFKLQLLFAHLSISQRPAYSPMDFLNISLPPWFVQGRQQDCSEYLKYMLDQLHEHESNRLRNQDMLTHSAKSATLPRSGPLHPMTSQHEDETLIRRTFGGKAVTTYRCLRCNTNSSRTEMFTDLPLAFHDYNPEPRMATRHSERKVQKNGPSASTEKQDGDSILLEEMLHNYMKPERLEGSNKYHCDICGGLEDGERTVKIVEYPEYLIITLLRFSFNAKTLRRSKILTDVKYPCTLSVPVHPSTDKASSMKRSRVTNSPPPLTRGSHQRFGLCSVVVHSGLSSDCGHYYCYARHSLPIDPEESKEKGSGLPRKGSLVEDHFQSRWYLFNDNRVSYSSYESFSGVTQRFSKDTAYALIYKKIHDSAVKTGRVNRNETIAPVNIDPPLRRDLRETVEKDNKLFLQEQELEGRARAMQQRNVPSSLWSNWRDDDNDGPPGSCGSGNGLGGMDTSGSRFVF